MACLYPQLFGNFSHHAKLFILHVKDCLYVLLLIQLKSLHFLALLSRLCLRNAHLNLIELFNMFDYLVLLLPSLANFLSTRFNCITLLLAQQLLTLLDQVFSDTVFAEKMTLWAYLRWLANSAKTKAALIELFLRVCAQTRSNRSELLL